jgi:hypothetical protein
MNDRSEWTLKEIREAYREILRAYNDLFPVHPQTTTKYEDGTQGFDQGDYNFLDTFRMKAKEVVPKLKQAADQSGNAQIWHRGEPLDSLNQGMRDRIGKALKLEI